MADHGAEHVANPAGLWLLIPVKPFAEAKSRLAPVLDMAERGVLMRRLLLGVLSAAQASALFTGIMVVSRDDEVLTLAAAHGAQPLREVGSDLNTALNQGRSALPADAHSLLVLPADLPRISVNGLRDFVLAAQLHVANPPYTPTVAIAPSLTGGTNALLLAPPNVIPFAFGVDLRADGTTESADRHAALAVAAGARLVTVRSSTLAIDVDLPEEYLLLHQQEYLP
jgi:2-phospho-L-lactate guanylyltransferase